MAFKDLSDFLEPLILPVNGKQYRIVVSPDAGFLLAGAWTGTDRSVSKMSLPDLFKELLGPVWDEMKADGVSFAQLMRVGLTVLTDETEGRDAAEAVWESGLDPKALLEFANRKANSPASTPSRSTASANGTPSRGSTTRTTSRKATQRARP